MSLKFLPCPCFPALYLIFISKVFFTYKRTNAGSMRYFLIALLLSCSITLIAQEQKVKPKKYPSLLWEITGKGLTKPSYLFGTMHVSSKIAFHLSDSFYIGIRNADVVALETDPGTWQEDMLKYDMNEGSYYGSSRFAGFPSDYLTINSLRFAPYEKLIAFGLHTNPSVINSFLYRSYEMASDFEEDTYLDLYIYQIGRKLGKAVCGVEDFHESMRLMKEAYADAAREKAPRRRSYDYDEDFSTSKLQEAYRTGNLDLLDTINQMNSYSAAFDEKFLYKRNEIQAAGIDSILKTKQSLFVGVGAAHLPGQRGVIEMLRRMGYRLRPIKMQERDSRHKEEVEKLRVPVSFTRQTAADGMYAVNIPGKLYSFMPENGLLEQTQFADMANGSYYLVTRLQTHASLWGDSEDAVYRKIDSLLYENIPGRMINKKAINKNGFRGFEITNRTRRGDFQRYNIFVTPFEILLFKMSGNGDYVKDGKEADLFFNSIELKQVKKEWKRYSPAAGGFEVEMPHQPFESKGENWQFIAHDKETGTGYMVLRTDVHNYQFVEEDSFDLALMEESFASSGFIDKLLSRRQSVFKGYAALDAKYRHKDGSISLVKFLIKGPHYYTLIAHARKEHAGMQQFLSSFAIKPFQYAAPEKYTDTTVLFTVSSPVPLQNKSKIDMNTRDLYGRGEEEELRDNGLMRSRVVQNDTTGEKIYVSITKASRYFHSKDTTVFGDTTAARKWRKDWVVYNHKVTDLPNGMKTWEYTAGGRNSSRVIKVKLFNKNGVTTRVMTQGDTLTAPSAFLTEFMNTIAPADTVQGADPRSKKTALFFADFFGKDTLLRKKAIFNVDLVDMDSTDFTMLKKAIGSLGWKEKKYLDTKKSFIAKLGDVVSQSSADYLKQLYFAAGDTLELQYAALDALLAQKTAYSHRLFQEIMLNEPPVLSLEEKTTAQNILVVPGNYDVASYKGDLFFDRLYDSLQLTATIFKELMPLMDIKDYEWPLMNLMAELVDSGLVKADAYESYVPKFLLEAKQAWKKQQISEKNRLINKAKTEEDDEKNAFENYYRPKPSKDEGNELLSFYARLLIPFWDNQPAVPQLLKQFLASSDKELKFTTASLFLRNKKALPDTLLRYFASLDDYRYNLHKELAQHGLEQHYPLAKFDLVALAKSKLLAAHTGYNRPDTVVYADRLPLTHQGVKGYVYFFRYKSKKDDANWKLATVGLVPADGKSFEIHTGDEDEDLRFDFTKLTGVRWDKEKPLKPQLEKELRKQVYSKRKSAAQFYSERDYGITDVILSERY